MTDKEPKIKHQWAVFRGEIYSKWTCGCVSVQFEEYPNGTRPDLTWMCLGSNCKTHGRHFTKDEELKELAE